MRKLFYLFVLFNFYVMGLISVSAAVDSNGVWHLAEDIRAGYFSFDEDAGDLSKNFTFSNMVYFTENIFAPVMYDIDDSSYFIDPASLSVLNNLNVNNIDAGNVDSNFISINGVDIHNIFVEHGEANSVTNVMLADNSVNTNNIIDNSVTTNKLVDNAITSVKIAPSTIKSEDIDLSEVQKRISGSCPSGSSIRSIDSNGGVVCEIDDINDGDYIIGNEYPVAGFGVSVSGRVVSVDTGNVQERVTGSCPSGSSIRSIDSNGGVVCEIDDIGTISCPCGTCWDTKYSNCHHDDGKCRCQNLCTPAGWVCITGSQ